MTNATPYKTLSVLMPAYNEEKTISLILGQLVTVARDPSLMHRLTMEIVVVNDGSEDTTEEQVLAFKEANTDIPVRYIKQTNQGKGAAIRKALQEATGDIFVVQDADLEYRAKDLSTLLPYILESEYEVVYGSRFLNHNNKPSYNSFYHGGRIVSLFANLLYGTHLTDESTCYKMFTRRAAESITLRCTGFEFCPEFTAKVSKLGYSIREVPVHYFPRSFEEGKKIKWKDGVIALWTLLKYRFVN
ncbi:MAG: glycosyltransferase family 2 protein [Paludibacteraceae bacterium]|nr:glycosyltransferase family 2 protein [Paludibacteraceae bacterium]